jgi:hypothetical protein
MLIFQRSTVTRQDSHWSDRNLIRHLSKASLKHGIGGKLWMFWRHTYISLVSGNCLCRQQNVGPNGLVSSGTIVCPIGLHVWLQKNDILFCVIRVTYPFQLCISRFTLIHTIYVTSLYILTYIICTSNYTLQIFRNNSLYGSVRGNDPTT